MVCSDQVGVAGLHLDLFGIRIALKRFLDHKARFCKWEACVPSKLDAPLQNFSQTGTIN